MPVLEQVFACLSLRRFLHSNVVRFNTCSNRNAFCWLHAIQVPPTMVNDEHFIISVSGE